jgi:hypothetical protein
MNFLSLFTRSKKIEETELQQGTPEVQKYAPTREEASRNSAPEAQ